MPRINSTWFEFCGENSQNYGVRIMDAFVITAPGVRGTSQTIAGRSGDLWLSTGDYNTITIKHTVRVPMSRYGDMLRWLDQSGKLVFSQSPEYAYIARFNRENNAKGIEFKSVSKGRDPLLEGQITFTCQPFRYMNPAPKEVTFAAEGKLHNPGTVFSQPKVTITGTGDFSVTIGNETLYFVGITGGIIIDSELMDALSLDGSTLMNDHMSGTPWSIQPGANDVSWSIDTGSITNIKILPRWRFL